MKKKKSIGIVGVGMVGGALRHYFESVGEKPFLFAPHQGLGSKEDINRADIIFICVPTPYDKKRGFDLSFVLDVLSWISGKKIIVVKSTVIPGTTGKLQKKYSHHRFLFNPEFLREKRAVEDMMHPDRQIVGYTQRSKNLARTILAMLPKAPFEKILPAREAEMVKYFGNTFLATKVIFANQMYELCEKLHIDYELVKECAGADPRIHPSHLDVHHQNYRGYGGKCLPKDIRALIQLADRNNVNLRLHKIVEKLNNELMRNQHIDDPEKV